LVVVVGRTALAAVRTALAAVNRLKVEVEEGCISPERLVT